MTSRKPQLYREERAYPLEGSQMANWLLFQLGDNPSTASVILKSEHIHNIIGSTFKISEPKRVNFLSKIDSIMPYTERHVGGGGFPRYIPVDSVASSTQVKEAETVAKHVIVSNITGLSPPDVTKSLIPSVTSSFYSNNMGTQTGTQTTTPQTQQSTFYHPIIENETPKPRSTGALFGSLPNAHIYTDSQSQIFDDVVSELNEWVTNSTALNIALAKLPDLTKQLTYLTMNALTEDQFRIRDWLVDRLKHSLQDYVNFDYPYNRDPSLGTASNLFKNVTTFLTRSPPKSQLNEDELVKDLGRIDRILKNPVKLEKAIANYPNIEQAREYVRENRGFFDRRTTGVSRLSNKAVATRSYEENYKSQKSQINRHYAKMRVDRRDKESPEFKKFINAANARKKEKEKEKKTKK